MDRGEGLGEAGLFGIVAHAFLLLAFEFVDVGDDVVDVVVGREELGCGLGADAGHAGDVVGDVATEAEHINDLIDANDVPLRFDLIDT